MLRNFFVLIGGLLNKISSSSFELQTLLCVGHWTQSVRLCVKSAVSADDNDEHITITTSSAGNDTRQVAATVVVMDADGITLNDGSHL